MCPPSLPQQCQYAAISASCHVPVAMTMMSLYDTPLHSSTPVIKHSLYSYHAKCHVDLVFDLWLDLILTPIAAMIRGNRANCSQFASSKRLDWLVNRLESQESSTGSPCFHAALNTLPAPCMHQANMETILWRNIANLACIREGELWFGWSRHISQKRNDCSITKLSYWCHRVHWVKCLFRE